MDIYQLRVSEVKPVLNEIINELSYNIYLKEHRQRYQQEQKLRHLAAHKKFTSSMYTFRNVTLEQFVKDYNNFLWQEINKSNMYLSPKIEENYRRNYHDGEVSPVTSLIFYLYFNTDKFKKFLARLLLAAYRNPYTDKRSI